MENESIENLDQLKKKYEYDEENFFEYDTICTDLSFACDWGISQLIKKIKDLIEKLKNYNGTKLGEREKYMKEMGKKVEYYENLRNKIFNDNIYYVNLIRNIHSSYNRNSNVENVKQVSINIIKNILDLRVKVFINYDKNIINLYDLIKQINSVFNF